MHLYTPILPMVAYYEVIIRGTIITIGETTKQSCQNYQRVPLRDHITPHYGNLGLIKLPDIVNYIRVNYFMIT